MMARSARWLWLTLLIVVADRAAKYAVERGIPEGSRRDLVPGFAALVHTQNAGIAFGLLSESASRWIAVFLIGSSAAIVLLLCWLLIANRAGGSLSQAGLALIAGGAAGNLLDRLLHGVITDFVELHAGSYTWPPFNVADSAITIGALLLMWELLHDGRQSSRENA